MTFNTGNPVGSADARDLSDNARNLDVAVNSDQETFQDRLGRTRLTFAGMASASTTGNPAIAASQAALEAAFAADQYAGRAEEAAAEVESQALAVAQNAAALAAANATIAANNAANRSEAAADVAQLSTSIFETAAAGLAGTTAGQYFSVPSSSSAEYLILYRNNLGSAVEVKRYPSSAAISALDAIQINRSKNYPLKQLTRNGITSPANVHFTVPMLDIKVIGPADALAGKYFRISYFQNGATLGGVAANGVILEEFPAATYESSDSRTIIHNYTDAPASYDRSKGGIQTFVIQPALRPSLRFVVTMDVSLMRPAGSPLNSSSSSANDGWSWIIDPSAYFPVATTGVSLGGSDSGPLYITYTHATRTLDVVSFSDGGMMRMSIGPNGYNNLPNPKSVSRAAGASPEVAGWEPVSTQSTEWFGVMHIQASTNGDGGERIATGGNHGSSGGAGGAQTARNLLCAVRVGGGAPLTANYSGYAESVQLSIVNELMAYNTITLGRYVLRQSFQLDFRGPAIFVRAKMRALEPIAVQRDRALQFVTNGFEDTIIFGDGANTGRSAFSLLTSTSGPKSQAPNAWSVNMRGPGGELSSWMDRGFGAASGAWVDANSALIHLSGSTSTHKGYNAVIYGGTMERALESGETYEWRGGYALRYGLSSGAGTGIDSTIPISLDGSARLAVIYATAKTDGL